MFPQVAAVTSRGVGNWSEVKSITPKKGTLVSGSLQFEKLLPSAIYWYLGNISGGGLFVCASSFSKSTSVFEACQKWTHIINNNFK